MNYFEESLEGYGRIHRNPFNRALHAVGIPLIQFCALGLLGLVRGPSPLLSGATLLIAIAFVIIARHNLRAAVAQTGFALVLAYLSILAAEGRSLPEAIGMFGGGFVLGWIVQFTGHAFERQPPDFVRTPLNLLLGPLFVLDEVFRVLPDNAKAQNQ